MTQQFTKVDLPYEPDSRAYFQRMRSLNNPMWMDSSLSAHEEAHDILTAAPIKTYRNLPLSDIELIVESEHGELLADTRSEALRSCPFPGGVIGYMEYEALHERFDLDRANTRTSVWAVFDWALIQDHLKKRSYAIFLSKWNTQDIEERVALLSNSEEPCSKSKHFSVSNFKRDMPYAHYKEAFSAIKNYIHAGDCYQINFTQRFSAQFNGNARAAFLHLRDALSGPYSCYLEFDDHQVLSFSPEQFLKLSHGVASTKPIKGTIRRSDDEEEDASLADELKGSAKNQSENLMIVDLLRNDFSKNCVPYSVKVPKLFSLESYNNVHHLVSTVVGKIQPDIPYSQFFEDCFPGGSITGAPKKRAMQIIDELEMHKRRVYCGSIVCLGANKTLNSSIAIRTLLIEDGNVYCWGGGGIVAESTLEEEYAESIQKVQVLLDSLEKANDNS